MLVAAVCCTSWRHDASSIRLKLQVGCSNSQNFCSPNHGNFFHRQALAFVSDIVRWIGRKQSTGPLFWWKIRYLSTGFDVPWVIWVLSSFEWRNGGNLQSLNDMSGFKEPYLGLLLPLFKLFLLFLRNNSRKMPEEHADRAAKEVIKKGWHNFERRWFLLIVLSSVGWL